MNKLSDKNPCDICTVDRQIENPYIWQCECDRCQKPYEWKKECVNRLREYESIGTVEECRAAVEKQSRKKPNIAIGQTDEDKLSCCPICEGNLDWTYNGFWRKGNPKYCSNCGQKLDWDDTK